MAIANHGVSRIFIVRIWIANEPAEAASDALAEARSGINRH